MFKQSTGAALAGVLAAALLLRFVALLFAARPDNAPIAALLLLTDPLVAPFAVLDRLAGQPQFGARLELRSLAALLVLLLLAATLWWRGASKGAYDDAQSK